MRKTLATIAVVGAALAGTASGAAASTAAALSANSLGHVLCKPAVIGGKQKCLARGQYCSPKFQKDYKKYGFSCSKRDKRGRYHLV